MVKTGIYLITNLINNKKYVGQSTHIYKRWGVHKNPNNWTDNALYRAFRKYGIDKFKFEILEECPKELLNDREIYWISYYNSFEDGYNLTAGGDNGAHFIKLSTDLVSNIIYDLINTSLTGNELALKYGVNKDMISHINNGKCWKRDELSYPLRKSAQKVFVCPICGKQTTGKNYLCAECDLQRRHDNCTIKLSKYELAKLISENSILKVAHMFGISDNGVIKTCKRLGLPTHIKEIKEWYLNNMSPDSLTE